MYQRVFEETARSFKSNLIFEAEFKVYNLTNEINHAIDYEMQTIDTPISLPYNRVKKLQNKLREAYQELYNCQSL